MLRMICLVLCGLVAPHAATAAPPAEGVGLTVYNQNFAVVRERRLMSLAAGRSTVRFQDVAATIVPETVQFRSLQPTGVATVIEQNYEYDLVSADALLRKYIDLPIGVVTREGRLVEGQLLSFEGAQLVLDVAGTVQLLPRGDNVKDIRFSARPDGLLTRPTLVWHVQSQPGGEQLVEVAYRAEGMRWQVDYRAAVGSDQNRLDLSGWVTVTNETGTTFENARLKLMAGDINVIEEPQPPRLADRMVMLEAASAAPQFEEKAFAEYHLYTLPRPTTIANRQTKQIQLLDVAGIPVQKKYRYQGPGSQIAVVLEFKNEETAHPGLGIALPKGPIRVFQTDTDDELEWIGGDEIDHTPKDETVRVRTGYAFDLSAERLQLNERRLAPRVTEKDWQIRLRNHKPQAVRIETVEWLEGRANWQIIEADLPYEKKDYQTIAFDVDVPANAERSVTYKVRYEW